MATAHMVPTGPIVPIATLCNGGEISSYNVLQSVAKCAILNSERGDIMPIIINKKMGRPSNRPDAETFAREYQTMTTKEIAEKYGVQPSTVRAWASRLRRATEAEEVMEHADR